MFDLFVQGDRTLDRAQGGLGIGLSVVKRLVELHGGRVRAAPGRARFELRDSPAAAERDDEPSVEAPASVRVPVRRVLVVDDNGDAADSLAIVLRLEGHHVESRTRRHDALERVQTLRPDVALLDIGLPQIDGYELARRIRAGRIWADPAGGADRLRQAEDKKRARLAGFDDYLSNPSIFRRSNKRSRVRTRLRHGTKKGYSRQEEQHGVGLWNQLNRCHHASTIEPADAGAKGISELLLEVHWSCPSCLLFSRAASVYSVKEDVMSNATVYEFTARTVDGKDQSLRPLRGQGPAGSERRQRVRLYAPVRRTRTVVTSGSEDRGFAVLGFPCNQFGAQEPGSEAGRSKSFCETSSSA